MLDDLPQSGLAAQPAHCQAEVPLSHCSLECGPEADERPERKREGYDVLGSQSDVLVDLRPALHEPVPTLLGIEPVHRPTGGPGGLMQPGIPRHRVGEVRPVTRMNCLIGDEISLRQQRQRLPLGERRDFTLPHASCGETSCPKGVPAPQFIEHLVEARMLIREEFGTIHTRLHHGRLSVGDYSRMAIDGQIASCPHHTATENPTAGSS
jgi:hypothetical protein